MSVHDDPWAEFRRQMPAASRWAYFDHAAVAPLSGPAAAAVTAWAQDASNEGGPAWGRWSRRLEDARRLAASLVGAQPEEIALVNSTTEGITLVAEGYPWQPGDNVVTLDDEFPSNVYPWLNLASRGVETRRVATDRGRVDLDWLADACDRRTRIVSVSWVGYASGWRNDLDALADLAHRRGALLMVDAIQGLGVFPLDVQRTPIDFFAADGHKWLLGPEAAALVYIRREHLQRLRPLNVGWNSVVHAHDFTKIALDLKPTAARYEGGSPNNVGFAGLAASLEMLLPFGAEALAGRVLHLTDLACQRLEEAGAVVTSHRDRPQHCSGIVSFECSGHDPTAARKYLLAAGVVVSCRAGRLRISPHAYNNEEDIERLIEALQTAP